MAFAAKGVFWIGLAIATIQLAVPLLCASLGETIGERAGVLNIGLEGTMLLGSFAAFLGAYSSGSDWIGVACGVGAGALVGLVLSYLCVTRGTDQLITGIAINLFMMGLITFVYEAAYTTVLPTIEPFEAITIPGLSAIPVIGQIFFHQTALVYLAFFLVPVVAFILYKTHFGLAVRAAGEAPVAVDVVGLPVKSIRFAAVILGAALAGLGGAALSVGQLSEFNSNLTAGRGFIALAIVVMGRWDPLRVAVASLLLGFGDALQLRLQIFTGIPPQFLEMIPYVVGIALITGRLGRGRAPRALGTYYSRA